MGLDLDFSQRNFKRAGCAAKLSYAPKNFTTRIKWSQVSFSGK